MHILVSDAVKAVNGTYYGNTENLDSYILSVTSDSRKCSSGCLFVAIKGTRVDGFDFIPKATEDGAVVCLSERAYEGYPCIVVDNVYSALQDLAVYYRSKLSIPVIGITGSVGKTTTKEMIASVLSQKYNVLKTPGNLNNELGVPLTLLSISEEHEVAVIEMGISHFGEMERLSRMVQPDIVCITIIGYSHLEFLKDRNGVLAAKGEIFKYTNPNGLAVLNGDDDLLSNYSTHIRKLTYGFNMDCDFVATDVSNNGENGLSGNIQWNANSMYVSIPAFGNHIFMAALPAVIIGKELGLTDSEIAKGLELYSPVGRRALIRKTTKYTIIDDCYNANPSSTKAAIDSMKTLSGRKVCILGDMKELGSDSSKLHNLIGKYAIETGMDLIITCGPESLSTFQAAKEKAVYYGDITSLIDDLPKLLNKGDNILVKASHSMEFEKITDYLMGEN